jgi:formate dehydrogenase subunit gamma
MAFAILAITGLLMFFHLANFATGTQVRSVHYVAAAFFGVMLFIYSVLDPRPSLGFLREAFHWERNNLDWLKASPGYYFRGRKAMPPQGRINGDQKLWQLVVILTSIILFLTGVVLWFFQFKISRQLYGGFLLMHALAFILILVTFFWHFYLRTLHPDFSESLSSMINGKVSESYAAEHYRKWHFGMAEPGGDTDSKETKSGR